MYTWEQTRDIVNEFINNLNYEREPKELYAPVTYTLSQSGKRVRPVLTLMAYNIYKENVEKALYPAVAMETYHNHTLIHDDVMDCADIRRGKPTVCAKWGDTMAILSGDTTLLLAYEFMSHVEDDKLRAAMSLLTETAKEVCDGQQYDIEFESRDNVSEQEYINMIRLKTSVLIAASIKLGALLAGASEEDQKNLYAYGETMGLAFQLQDDLLDVYGDTAVFGKKIGGDIRCNKKTYLLIKAFELASQEQRSQMYSWINDKECDNDAKVLFFTNLYNTLGVKEACEARIAELFAKCDEHLAQVSAPEERKTEISLFINSLLNRNL